MKNLAITALQGEFEGFLLKWYWYPGLTLETKHLQDFQRDVDAVNQAHAPLQYGYFAPDVTPQSRKTFLDTSIWCLIYAKNKPVGFVYNVDLGRYQGQRIIHLGLVKMITNAGKDFIRVPYIPLGLGNLLNFGEYYATNVSHLPIIIDMVTWLCRDVYPAFEFQDSDIRKQYQPILDILRDKYLIPVLGYQPSALCTRTFTVRDALADAAQSGFNTEWNTIPKSSSFLCNMFVKEWLHQKIGADGAMHIQDDMIQIGKVDFRFLGDQRIYSVLNSFAFAQDFNKDMSLFQRLTTVKIAS